MTPRVLLVQTQPQTAQFLSRFFEDRGDEVTSVLDLGLAATQLAQYKPDLMVLDLHFPGNEWQAFLRILRVEYPELKVIVTSKYPDMEREVKAQEMGVKAFVRQPFTTYWLNKALEMAGLPSASEMAPEPAIAGPARPPVRFPVRLKITLPLVFLTLLFAMVGAYAISQVILRTAQARFESQLVDSGLQSADWMVRQEERLLETLRLISNSQGIAAMVEQGQAEALRGLVLPVAVNSDEETIEVLNTAGTSVLSMRKLPGSEAGDYTFSRGETFFKDLEIVRLALQSRPDAQGDKFADLVRTPWGDFFYIAGAITNEEGRVVGALLAGRSPENMLNQMQQEKLPFNVTFYDVSGRPIASSLFSEQESFPLALSQASQLLSGQKDSSLTRHLDVHGAAYSEIIGQWSARGGVEDLGLMGVALPQAFLIRVNQLARFEIFAAVAAGLLLVVLVGFYLGGLISSPVERLTEASSQLAQGNFGVQLEVKGNDEVAALAQSFNNMVTGLQEGIIFRDLLGRAASPQLREQLRQTFSSGSLRLEGQETVATIMISSVNGLTEAGVQCEPPRLFEWLNEYFGQLVPIVIDQGGVVNQFDGDVMTALFGILPVTQEPKDSACSACRSALRMIETVDRLNERRLERGDPPMITNIGIHTGKIIAGALGSTDRLHYTVMGAGVNITRQVASIAQEIHSSNGILLSQATFVALNDCSDHFKIEPVGTHSIKGKPEELLVYRLSSLSGPQSKVM